MIGYVRWWLRVRPSLILYGCRVERRDEQAEACRDRWDHHGWSRTTDADILKRLNGHRSMFWDID